MTQHSQTAGFTPVTLGPDLSIEAAFAVATGAPSRIAAEATDRCAAAAARLARVIEERRHVYGITTGFGPLADRLIDPKDAAILQQNLVHHLASGVGDPFGWVEARAIVLARLCAILRGASGASDATIRTLHRVLAGDLAPEIPQRGTVGASGDLTPLAHMVLDLQGRGAFRNRDGARIAGLDALAALGIAPLDLSARDGLALVNGTSAMTGLAICNGARTGRLLDWAIAVTGALADVLEGRVEAWSPVFADLRPHAGQCWVSERLRARIAGSDHVVRTPLACHRVDPDGLGQVDWIGQDAYTLRCAPQVLGAVHDAVTDHNRWVTIELNSVTDNPVFPDGSDGLAFHGGNFMGQHLALASDALANAVTVLAGLAERQIARLCDERLNRGLPPFLQRGPAGLNSGLMGAQVTATALVAEMRATGPASLHSISTNAANQDVVSMGTVAARLAADKIARASEVIAIAALAVAQALDLREADGWSGFSEASVALRAWVRARSAALDCDRPLGEEIADLARAVLDQSPPPVSGDRA